MENPATAGRSVARNSIILGIFAMVTVGLIAVTQQGTAERIADEIRRVQLSALTEILPDEQHDNDMLRHRAGGITANVTDHYAVLAAVVQIDIIGACGGNGDHFQLR